jgi:CHAT domain-containing protein
LGRGDVNSGETLFDQGRAAFATSHANGNQDQLNTAVERLRQARYLPWRSLSSLPRCLEMTAEALEDRLRAEPLDRPRVYSELIEVFTVLQSLDDSSIDKARAHGQRGYYLMLGYISGRTFTDLNDAVIEFKTALSLTKPDQTQMYRRALNVAWACEERFDFTRSRGQDYRTIVIDDPSRNLHLEMTGPYDLVFPISQLEMLIVPDFDRVAAPSLELAAIKRNLANLLVKNAIHSRARPDAERIADVSRAVGLLEDALTQAAGVPELELTVVASLETAVETRLLTRDGNPLSGAASNQSPQGLDGRIARLQRLEATASHPELTARLRMTMAALLLLRGGRTNEQRALKIYHALASTDAQASPSLSLSAAMSWATHAVSHHQWREVLVASRYGTQRVRALMASQASWTDRYRATLEAGRLAAFAAWAHIELGDPAAAVEILESGRALMITAQTGPSVDESVPVPDRSNVHYLLYAGDDAVAVGCTGDGAWRALRLAQFLPSDELRRYLLELDGFHGDPTKGVQSFAAAVNELAAHLQHALTVIGQDTNANCDVVLIPVGALTLLPVASALVQTAPDTCGVTVIPTRRLLSTPRGLPTVPETSQLLVVRDHSLPATGYEERVIKGFFPESVSFAADSPKDALLRALPHDGVVHFACHAEVKPRAPLNSAILLPNGEALTVSDLLGATLPRLRLAVLSACETGVADPETPDEAVSLATALLANGTQGVISTLWPVEDLSTTLMMARFYWNWRTVGTRPSVALRHAQRWQAQTADAQKIAFVHDLARTGLLSRDDADDLTEDLSASNRSLNENRYAAPYFWSGFVFSGQ